MRTRMLVGFCVTALAVLLFAAPSAEACGDETIPTFTIPVGGSIRICHYARGWIRGTSPQMTVMLVVDHINEPAHGEMSLVSACGYLCGPYYSCGSYWYYLNATMVTQYDCFDAGTDVFSFSVWKQDGGGVVVEDALAEIPVTGGFVKVAETFYQIMNAAVYDLDVDSDRDGQIKPDDAKEDKLEEKTPIKFYKPKEGALVVPNCDDDDSNNERDYVDNIKAGKLTNPKDEDVAEMILRVFREELEENEERPDEKIVISLAIENKKEAKAVRVYDHKGKFLLGAIQKGDALSSLRETRWEHGDGKFKLRIEGIAPGKEVQVKLKKRHVWTGGMGTPQELDHVQVKVAPYLLISNLPKTLQVYGAAASTATDWLKDIRGCLKGWGFTKENKKYSEIGSGEVFIQDAFEIGYTRRIMKDSSKDKPFHFCLDLPKSPAVKSNFLAKDLGYYKPKGWEEGPDDGGNIECSPPVKNKPFGIGIFGNTLSKEAENFFVEQKEQTLDDKKVLRIPVKWLKCKHVDGVLGVAPRGGDWVIYVGDLEAAIGLLKAENKNYRIQTFQEGGPRTVSSLLDEYENTAKEETKAIIDNLKKVVETLQKAFDKDRIKKIPVLYSPHAAGVVQTWVPNAANFQVIDNHLLVPAPEWKRLRDKLKAEIGANVTFVNTHDANAKGGNAHCLTNVKRKIPEPGKAK